MTSLAGSLAAPILGFDPFVNDRRRLAVTIGDSTASGTATMAVPSAVVANGRTVTVTVAGNNVGPGARILMSRADQEEFNGLTKVDTAGSGVFTYTTPERAPKVANATSALGFQIRLIDSWSGTNLVALASAMSGCLFDDIVNLSIGGETAEQTHARLGQALDLRPALLEIATGVNSVTNDIAAEAIFADIRSMAAKGVAAGAVVLLRTVGPLGSGHGSYSTARLATINRLNRLIRRYAWAHAGRVVLVDTFALFVDPMSTAGDFRSGYSSDSIHPLSKAMWYAAKDAAPKLAAHFQRLPWPAVSVTDDVVDDPTSLNLFEFGLCTGSGGTITAGAGNSGTISDGLSATIQSTPVSTVSTHGQARADGIGFNNRCVITANSSGDGITFPAVSATIHQRVDDYPGRQCQLGVNMVVTSLDVDTANVQFSFNLTEDGFARTINGMNGLVIPAGETADLWFVTPPAVIPPGVLSSCRPRLTATLSGAGELDMLHGRWFMEILPEGIG